MKKLIAGIIALIIAGLTLSESPESLGKKVRDEMSRIKTTKTIQSQIAMFGWLGRWFNSHVTQNMAINKGAADKLLKKDSPQIKDHPHVTL